MKHPAARMSRNSWTSSDDRLLRRHYPAGDLQTLADRLGRSLVSIKARAHRLGIARTVNQKRPWTEREKAILKKHYMQRDINWCAAKTGHSRTSTWQMAAKLGLRKLGQFLDDGQIIAAIKELHPLGYTDPEICATLVERHPGHQANRHRVAKLRSDLGLGSNQSSERSRRRVAAKTREQLSAAGLSSIAQLRRQRWNQWKRDLGWPEELTIRSVMALELFWTHGPLTRVQLCALMGCSPKKRTSPVSNGPGGTVLAELQRAGLVCRLRKAVPLPGDLPTHGQPPLRPRKTERQPKTKWIDLYFLNEGVAPNGNRKAPVSNAAAV